MLDGISATLGTVAALRHDVFGEETRGKRSGLATSSPPPPPPPHDAV